MTADDADDDREDLLAELLDAAKGVGKYRGHGAGLLTTPGGSAEGDEQHNLACELERRGLLRRVRSAAADGAVAWEARPGLKLHGEDG